MPRVEEEPQDTTDIGWRLKQLRLRHKLTQSDLARLAEIDVSYLSRAESSRTAKPRPKRNTVDKLLDAMGATSREREALFHVEECPLSPSEIDAVVKQIAAVEEDNPLPVTIVDNRWFRRYQNRSMRAVLDLDAERYKLSLGEHVLCSMIDPRSPMYNRFVEDERRRLFAWRSATFKLQFANQEFDSWYREILAQIRQVPWALQIWEDPQEELPQFLMLQEISFNNPRVGKLNFLTQANQLMRDPRFVMLHMTPQGEETVRLVHEISSDPRYAAELSLDVPV